MARDVSTDTQEIFGEMQEDLARTKASVRHNRNSNDSGSPGKSMLVWGFIGIILILLIVLLFRGGDKAVTEELNTLKGRVEQMEKKAAALDAAAKKVDTVDGQIKGFSNRLRRWRELNDPSQSAWTGLPSVRKKPQHPSPLKRNRALRHRQRSMRSDPERPYLALPRNTTSLRISSSNSTT